MNNYEFCARWILDQEHGNAFRVLDYGCGSGQIVEQLKKRSAEASGCDVFYQGGSYSKSGRSSSWGASSARRLTGCWFRRAMWML